MKGWEGMRRKKEREKRRISGTERTEARERRERNGRVTGRKEERKEGNLKKGEKNIFLKLNSVESQNVEQVEEEKKK